MTDLVAELRKRANALEAEALANPGQEATNDYRHAEAHGLFEAAELVEADPLYKAVPEMLRILRLVAQGQRCSELEEAYDMDFEMGEVRAILATLPKETPP